MTRLLFFDIQTVAEKARYEALSTEWQALWQHKAAQFASAESAPASYIGRAGRLAEFGRLIAAGIGALHIHKDPKTPPSLRVKVLFNRDEKKLLTELCALLDQPKLARYTACAHNGKSFCFPYLCRRCLVHQLPLPQTWQLKGRKPWQTEGIRDTMDDWTFGDFKQATPLRVLCALFKIPQVPSAEKWLEPADLHQLFYQKQQEDPILAQSFHNVCAQAQLYLRLNGLPYLNKEAIEHTSD